MIDGGLYQCRLETELSDPTEVCRQSLRKKDSIQENVLHFPNRNYMGVYFYCKRTEIKQKLCLPYISYYFHFF